jgi:hypothetical protein
MVIWAMSASRHSVRLRRPSIPCRKLLVDSPETLRTYAALFDRMVPSEATCAAARALRFMANEIERRQGRDNGISGDIAHGARVVAAPLV